MPALHRQPKLAAALGLLLETTVTPPDPAFFAAGEMAVAYFMVHAAGKALDHAPNATEQIFPIINKGELAVLYCWFFIVVLFYGSGRWSIDALLCKGKGSTSGASATA